LVIKIIVFTGIGTICLLAGGIGSMFILQKTSKGHIWGMLILSLILIGSSSCTVKVPMSPDVGIVYDKERLPVETGLLITEENRNYVFKGNPESFTMSARPHEFPLGEALEKSALQAFSQIFQKVSLVRTNEEAKKFKLFIEPKIEDFHFRYDQLSYAGFAIAVLSKIKVHVNLASGEKIVWEKSVESPEQKKGPWAINFGYEIDVGESASDALIFTLRQISSEIVADSSIKQFIEMQ
jgi:hypothetical protein